MANSTINNARDELRENISNALTVFKPAPFPGAEPIRDRRASEKQIDAILSKVDTYVKEREDAARKAHRTRRSPSCNPKNER